MRFGERRSFGRRFGDSRFDRDRYDAPKPIKVGEEYDVEIKEMGSKGDGIARVNNFVVFVNGAKLGEKVHIKITDVRNRFAIGERTDESSKKEEVKEMADEEGEEQPKETPEETPEEEPEAGEESSEE